MTIPIPDIQPARRLRLCALASVGVHQMYKQAKEKKEEP